MSYGLMVYAVKFDKLKPVFGSGDDKLRRQICGRFKERLAQQADWFKSEIAGGAPTPFDAVKALIMGTVPEKGHGFMYAYAYERIVEHFGRYLDNSRFSSIRWSYMEAVEEGWKQSGLDETLPFRDLHLGKALCVFPTPNDFPSTGYWSPEQVVAGNKRFGEIQISAEEDYIKEAILAVRGWLSQAAAKGEGIVAFYY
ncbi:hypothetical protein [Polyangium sp. y55x31]|uniref:DUF7691 family protein n=1 Tax=Polyangium sp. y55x31 TaxID=3042688 RepID=UPI002482A213|nr:hypothetical protein [Polyangium sp. y55x31]MDI1478556.1 hypothetical protein [Polyangium sp. y55x31]